MMDELVLAASGAATVVQAGSAQWRIGDSQISKTLRWEAGAGCWLVALEDRLAGQVWCPDLHADGWAGGEFCLLWDGAALSARQATALYGVRAWAEAGAVLLQIDLGLAGGLDASLCYRLVGGTAAIEQWVDVLPRRAGTLSRVAPLTVSAASLATPTLHWLRGLQNHGAGMPDSGPYPAFQLRHEPLGQVQLHSGLRSTWHEIAWFALDSGTAAAGLFAGLLYSGRWSATAASLGCGAALQLYSEGYVLSLAAGARWCSPAALVGVYFGDLDAAAHRQHTYLRNAVMPATPPDFPWVQYNTWFAHLIDIDETILRQEAALAASAGAEVFVIDAGWWEPSRRTRDNFSTGLGAWVPSREKFPSGLPAFGDYVRSLGMRFGIWVEPERVDLRHPATWQLSWLARHHDAIVSPSWPPDTVSGWLCFGHPEVQAWALDWISRLITAVGADWLKWDSNWWGVCTCTRHGHSAGDGEFYQIQGVHAVLAELRRRFPHLILENCAGGGTRTDLAMLANTHITWLHDASTPSRRVRYHLAGATYFLPPELCNTWVVDADDESLADPATPRAALDTILRSRMFGAFGVSARLTEWSASALAALQEAVALYKTLRPLLKQGHFYHLLPQATLLCPDLELHGQWEAYAVVEPATQSGALWVFRPQDGLPARAQRRRGLEADRTYTLTDTDTGQQQTVAGARLLASGLWLDLGERTSALYTWSAQAGQ